MTSFNEDRRMKKAIERIMETKLSGVSVSILDQSTAKEKRGVMEGPSVTAATVQNDDSDSSPNENSVASSYQVLDPHGKRTSDIYLPSKQEFQRDCWMARCFHPRTSDSILKADVPVDSLTLAVEEAVEQLRNVEDPTIEDSLSPLGAVLERLVHHGIVTLQTADLLGSLVVMIVLQSAEFFHQVSRHTLDSTLLSPRAQYRALTNYWVYFIIESIYQDDCASLEFSLPAYAYGMIYPFSDDIMDLTCAPDDANVKDLKQIQKEFVVNVEQKLSTGRNPSRLALRGSSEWMKREERVYQLIDDILGHDHNNRSSSLLASLITINRAQLASVKQHCDKREDLHSLKLSKHDRRIIFEITVQKGAAATMPVAYLDHESISRDQAELAATIGYLGQFLNDVEGLHDDFVEKNLTPVLLTYLKHGCIDKFVQRWLVHVNLLSRRAADRWPSLSTDRIRLLLDIFRVRLLATTALCHTRAPILSSGFVDGLEREFGIPLSLLSQFGSLEQELFGGDSSRTSNHGGREQVSSPETFRDFVIETVKKFLQDFPPTPSKTNGM